VNITDTLATINALLTDPRADHNQPDPTPPASTPRQPLLWGVGTKPYVGTILRDHENPGDSDSAFGVPDRLQESWVVADLV
jgi:hypothetical protein